MNRIRVLDDHTINQIAAGEVVERPASVVKELVENSLDAGSTRIRVEVEEAGTQLIRVTDDGNGMSRDDLELSVRRHATSKLAAIDDLSSLTTLGFRGEALPSIAAVAELEIVSREPESLSGHRLRTQGRAVAAIEQVGAPFGTTVTVQGLFQRIPARRKHLRSAATEFNHISRVIHALALANPGVAFRLSHNSREVLRTPGRGDVMDAVVSLYGTEFARQLLPIPERKALPGIAGFVGSPGLARANRDQQYVFVNRRFIYSGICRDAVEAAYQGLLPVHRHPVFLLYLTVRGDNVDINVHPAKERARFVSVGVLRAAIRERTQAALDSGQFIPSIEVGPGSGDAGQGWSRQSGGGGGPGGGSPGYPAENHSLLDSFRENQDQYTGYPGWPEFQRKADAMPSSVLGKLRALVQVERSYIVAQGPDGFYIVDQHAAHERLMYERLLAAAEQNAVEEQVLAVPAPVRLTPGERELLDEHASWLSNWGFSWEPFGANTVLLRAVPTVFGKEANAAMFLELLDRLEDYKQGDDTLLRDQRAAIIMGSCKAAVKAHDRLQQAEQQALLDQLAEADAPYTCPHGRPTLLRIGFYELEKYFKRVQ